MDCNKEEAERAKKLAEEKMRAGDFVGAHSFVTKAQRLYPNLENVLQMITICDVHSSANKKINGLDNWYAILQVHHSADADTIKKQYRKLVLLLHPDKNKFAGAEAAFKLVGEANRLLSDQIKRSQYDVRYRSHSMLASKQSYANSARHSADANNAADNIVSGYTFWTCCNNCGHRYKYMKHYMNAVMQCSICQKSYFACNIGFNGVPPSSSTAGAKQFDHGMYNNGTVGGKLNKKNHENQKKGAGDRNPKEDEGYTEYDAEGEKPQNGETGTDNSAEIPKADVLKPQPEVKEPETSAAKSMPDLSAPKKNQAAKKRRKDAEESSKSFEVDGSDVTGDKTDTNEYNKRKSSRKTPHVSYTDRGSDSDFVSPLTKKTKSGCEFQSDSNTKQMAEDNKSPEYTDSGVSIASSHAYRGKAKKNVNSGNKNVLSARNKENEGCDCNGEDTALSSKIDKVENGYKANENPKVLDVPDPEFNVFEDGLKPEKFAVNQLWSTCDSRDGMPRRYVRVRKVLTSEFKLRITYLEPVWDDKDNTTPVACGKFKNGETKEVECSSIFSAQMLKSSCNRVVSIYPRKGEIWAIFRDWNEEWNNALEKHKFPYKYDFVEVLTDFRDDVGIGVAYMGKIKGFVSLFHQEAQNGVCQVQFTAEEMLRFSHKVPAVKMSGKEKECVPADSYELDPTALPKDIFQVDTVNMEMDSENLKGKADGPYPEAPKVEVKAKPAPEITPSPRKHRKSNDYGICSNYDQVCTRSVSLGEVKGGISRTSDFSSCQVNEKSTPNESRKSGKADAFKQRKSPRFQTTPSQQRDEKKSAKQGDKMNTPKRTDKDLVTDSLGIRNLPKGIQQQAETQVGEGSKKRECNGELQPLSKQNDLPTQLDGSTNDFLETNHLSSSCKKSRRNAFDFEKQRSEAKFRVNQIWAIYSNDKGMPSEYVKIKKIETKPKFVFHVTHMELYPPCTEPVTRPVSCGDFKMKTGKPKILPRASFSHQVKRVDSKKVVKVYPRKGEIWALYKTCDISEEEHDIVEVVEGYCEGESVKAMALTAKGSSPIYIIQRKQESNAGLIDIPKAEMSRFSHRILAVRHEKRTTRLVEGGYWELDPAAIPGRTI